MNIAEKSMVFLKNPLYTGTTSFVEFVIFILKYEIDSEYVQIIIDRRGSVNIY